MPRHFTLEQARATLPVVRRLLSDARVEKQRLDAMQRDRSAVARLARGNGHISETAASGDPTAIEQATAAIRAAVQQLIEMGILVKDLESGLVDWPSLREGREVYLCWRLGEATINYWHERDGGFAGRQPL